MQDQECFSIWARSQAKLARLQRDLPGKACGDGVNGKGSNDCQIVNILDFGGLPTPGFFLSLTSSDF